MEYFAKFPVVTETYENFSVKILDLLCYYSKPIDEFNLLSTTQQNISDVGSISYRIYNEDVSNFWSIVVSNQSENPWTVFPDPISSIESNMDGNYSMILLDPFMAVAQDSYQAVKEGDIVGYYNLSFTQDNCINYIRPDGDYGFVKGFNFDTSTLTIVKPIDLVTPSRFSPLNTAATKFYILDKQDDGSYELRRNSANGYYFNAQSKSNETDQIVYARDSSSGNVISASSSNASGTTIKDSIAYPGLGLDEVDIDDLETTFTTHSLKTATKEEVSSRTNMLYLEPTDVSVYYSSLKV